MTAGLPQQAEALADEATAIVDRVDAQGRAFTQEEDDRIKAIFAEALAASSAIAIEGAPIRRSVPRRPRWVTVQERAGVHGTARATYRRLGAHRIAAPIPLKASA